MAADEGDAWPPRCELTVRKGDEPKDERGERERIPLVALDLERRAAVGVVPKLGDLSASWPRLRSFFGFRRAAPQRESTDRLMS